MASSEMTEHVARLYRAIYAVVRRIPAGRVATYGQVAELAGIPGGARVAGAALKAGRPGDRLPWQRVIGKAGPRRGRIAIHNPIGAAIQRQLLDKEGVEIGDSGLIALDRYGWLPTGAGARRQKRARGTSMRGATAGSGRGASPRRRPRSGAMRRDIQRILRRGHPGHARTRLRSRAALPEQRKRWRTLVGRSPARHAVG